MNAYEMALGVVIVVMIFSGLKALFKFQSERGRHAVDPESARLKEEVTALRERIQVLERIATDKESQLEREIERLRDR